MTQLGKITGIPTSIQDATTYTYTVTDNHGDTATLSFTIVVLYNDTIPTFSESSIVSENYLLNEPISTKQLPEAIGGNAPLTYSLSPALPTGLIYDSSTRQIAGTPVGALVDLELTYTVTDNDGSTTSLTFSIRVTLDNFSFLIGGVDYIDYTRKDSLKPVDSIEDRSDSLQGVLLSIPLLGGEPEIPLPT